MGHHQEFAASAAGNHRNLDFIFAVFVDDRFLEERSIQPGAQTEQKVFGRFPKAKNLQTIAAATDQFGAAPLVAVFEFGYREIERQVSQRGSLVNKAAVERSLQLGISEEVTKLEMNMAWLATVASVSPFIGLFGTVWGIIDAFESLGRRAARVCARWRQDCRSVVYDGDWFGRGHSGVHLLQHVRQPD